MGTERHLDDYVTPITPLAVYAALRLASASLPDGELGHASLLLLTAHVGFETGWHSAHGYNLGNFKHVPGDGHDYISFLTTEYVHGEKQTVVQDFRAYPNLDAGVADYLHGIYVTFGFAWPAVQAGDVEDYVHRLKLRGYFTAPERDYAAGMARVMADVSKQLSDDTPTDPQTPFAVARTQPPPGTDEDPQPLPPSDLSEPEDA